jgi:hypothetical protein
VYKGSDVAQAALAKKLIEGTFHQMDVDFQIKQDRKQITSM